ncbi:hypothetical protein KJ845_03005, partial [Patescibacteria group bacterium]|nr:hypothetical protein [Patescibacteria group bacterium]
MIIQKKQKFLIILSAFLLSLLFIYLAKNNFLVKYDFLETSEIISPDISDSTKLIFTPIVDTNGSLTNSGLVINNITPQNPAEILIPFKQTIFLDGLSVYFYGDLHSATSTPPKKFAIYYADQDNNWHLISRVNEYNNKPLYNLLFSNTIKTNVIKIVISEAVTDNSVWLQDLRFYSKQKTNLLTGLINYFDTYKYSLPAYWVYYLIFLSLLFIPGLTLITFFNQRKKFNLDISLLLLLSPLISLIIMFTGTVVYLLTGWALALNFYIFVFI